MELDEIIEMTTRDGQALSVRRLRRTDHKPLKDFNAGLSPESRRWFFPHPYDDATVLNVLTRSETGDDFTLGAFAGGRMVGYFFLWRARARVPLLGIGITDGFQRRALGEQMMRLLVREARNTGRDGIELTTAMDNHGAFALHTKMGFVHYKDVENRVGDGRIVVERAMFYAIRPGAKPMEGIHGPPVPTGCQLVDGS